MTEGEPEIEWSPEEKRLLERALLAMEPAECDCPGRDGEVRRFLESPAAIDDAFRDHLLNCFACWSTLQGELAEREFGTEAVDEIHGEVLQRVLRPDRMALDHPEPLSRIPALMDSILAHPPFDSGAGTPEITELHGQTLRALDRAFATHPRVTLDAAAGSGKTFLLAHWLRKLPGQKVLWVVPFEMMVPQVRSALHDGDVTVVSAGTGPEPAGEFDLAILEGEARPWTIRAKRTLFVTPAPSTPGTPVVDTLSLARLVESGLWRMPRQEFINTGLRYCLPTDPASGDFSTESLRSLDDPARNGAIVDRVLDLPGRRIVMAVDDAHARSLADLLNARAPSLHAAAVPAGAEGAERRRMSKELGSGILSTVVDGGPLLDSPTCRGLGALVLARPTLQPDLYARMVSRACPAMSARRPLLLVEVRDRLPGLRGPLAGLSSLGLSPRD